MKVKSISNNWVEENEISKNANDITYTIGINGVKDICQAEFDDKFDVFLESGEIISMRKVKYVKYFPKEPETEESKQDKINCIAELNSIMDEYNIRSAEEEKNRNKKLLRDEFAKQALNGLLAGLFGVFNHGWSSDDFAVEAYDIADSMLKARENV